MPPSATLDTINIRWMSKERLRPGVFLLTGETEAAYNRQRIRMHMGNLSPFRIPEVTDNPHNSVNVRVKPYHDTFMLMAWGDVKLNRAGTKTALMLMLGVPEEQAAIERLFAGVLKDIDSIKAEKWGRVEL